MSPATIHGSEQPIKKIFSDDFVFTIPSYQRPYAWTTDEAEELLDDLLTFLRDETEPLEKIDPYFLGSIVLIKDATPPADVVDGQQRLTTLTILLSVLRKLLPADNAQDITAFIYQQGNTMTGAPNRYRITLRPRDAEFFQKYIQHEGGIDELQTLHAANLSDSQQHIRTNALHYLNHLGTLQEAQRVRLAQFIVSRCFLVVVCTPDFDSAYRIFSVLNSRGLPLSHTDVLKSNIIGRIPENQRDEYTRKWEDAEEALGRDEFQDLFSHIRMLYRKTKMRNALRKEFQDHVLRQDTPDEVEPRQFIDETLLPSVDAFHTIIGQAYQGPGQAATLNWLFSWLNRIDNFDWLPPAILYLKQHTNEPELLVDFFTDLERLAVGLMIMRANINARIERYSALLRTIEVGGNLATAHAPLQLDAAERSEIRSALDGDIYRMSPRLRQYILLRLDEALSDGTATYRHDTISIEHVLPQNPATGSVWARWFPDAKQQARLVHRLGNLVLLSRRKNSAASNYDFEKKKRQYFTKSGSSPFVLTTQVLREREWTPAVVEQRQRELHQRLIELWRL